MKTKREIQAVDFILINAGLHEIEQQGNGFCFDIELGRHKVYVGYFGIITKLVSNRE